MLFNSISFLIFFPVTTTLYFLCPHKYRWFVLLSASVFFYMSFIPAYILILLVTITIDYLAAIYIEKTIGPKKKTYLIISIISTLFVLFIFKYFNFFIGNFDTISYFFKWNYSIGFLNVILPIGLSFHTFQSLSYVIEVYRGNQKAEHNLGIYSLYVMFYPQLVAGPIERPQNLLHQFYEKHSFDFIRITDGLKLMLWGFFLKVAIADRLAVYVDTVYNHPTNYTGIPLILATVFFSFQIYCDFAGYSLIAIGSAKVMGFRLMENFNRPYFSESISEFWKRWHISLSTWFRDYLYLPLGGNRVKYHRWLLNLFIVFLVSGFWHGASWTYIIWGSLHGFYLIFSILTRDIRKKLSDWFRLSKYPKTQKALRIVTVFLLISFAWIFFRANTTFEAVYIATHLFSSFSTKDITLFGRFNFILMIGSIGFMESIQFFNEQNRNYSFLKTKSLIVPFCFYSFLILYILYFGVFNEKFIYFQF